MLDEHSRRKIEDSRARTQQLREALDRQEFKRRPTLKNPEVRWRHTGSTNLQSVETHLGFRLYIEWVNELIGWRSTAHDVGDDSIRYISRDRTLHEAKKSAANFVKF